MSEIFSGFSLWSWAVSSAAAVFVVLQCMVGAYAWGEYRATRRGVWLALAIMMLMLYVAYMLATFLWIQFWPH